MLTKVKETIHKHRMVSPGDRVLVAVSGGPDSVCLLDILQALARELDLTLHVAHLDHMFRGAESAAEAQFVRNLAEKLGIPATVESIDVPAFCRERGLSAQAGAREARYDFLARAADKAGASRIATGHTADDQAETFLMRLLRGAGVSGLSSIPPVRRNIIRPLIEATRQEVLEHLKTKNLEFKTDPSNLKPLYTRNRIRLEVMPVLRQFNPRVVETLASEATLLRDEDEAVEACLKTIGPGIIASEDEAVIIKRDEFNALPQAFKRRLFRKAADTAGLESSGLASVQVDEALAFMASARTGRTMDLSFAITIEREYGRFILRRKTAATGFSRDVALPGKTAVPELGMIMETMIAEGPGAAPETDKNYLWQALFDYDRIRPPLALRNRKPGDWLQPAGMGGRSKKLQDYFVDAKIPRRKRDLVPLLVAGEDILWIVGQRTDERFLVTAGTKKALVVRIKQFRSEE